MSGRLAAVRYNVDGSVFVARLTPLKTWNVNDGAMRTICLLCCMASLPELLVSATLFL